MPSTYDSTIVAAFRDNSDAQAAAQELQSQGINRDDIYIQSGQANLYLQVRVKRNTMAVLPDGSNLSLVTSTIPTEQAMKKRSETDTYC
jgi:sugar/nucleoside kinase (ribokinase family)